MSLEGKGFFIWKIRDCEAGNPENIAAIAKQAGLQHVLIKIADGVFAYNKDRNNDRDLVPPVVEALRAQGISVWGWHYIYGNHPISEANIAAERVKELGLDGYVIDAEIEFEQPGKANAAQRYIDRLRTELPNLPLALSSFRFPSFHPRFPWSVFLEKIDINMPQVYWEQAHNPAVQLRRVVKEFKNLNPVRPVIPTGPAYKAGGWSPTVSDTNEFLNTCKTLKFTGANFFSWDECRDYLLPIWSSIADYVWNQAPVTTDFAHLLIAALNTHDPVSILSLYLPDAVHINFARTVTGTEAIRGWYNTFFNQMLPGAKFSLSGFSGTDNTRHIHWTAVSSKGKVTNGNDTIGLLDGKIAYHYTFFSVKK
jgi:hypothetical protein